MKSYFLGKEIDLTKNKMYYVKMLSYKTPYFIVL